MKKISYFVALAALLFGAAACQNDTIEPAENANTGKNEGLVFRATLEGADATRTTIEKVADGYKVTWEEGDEISINGVVYTATPQANPAEAIFTKKREGDPDPTAPFTAYYPASIYDGTNATLPATQVYKAEGSIAGILPMYATNATENVLNFKNLCGLMKFTLKGTEKVRKIILADDTKALSGKFTVSDDAAVLDDAAEGGIALDCGAEGVQLDESTGKTFYVAVPAGSYKDLHIKYYTVNYSKYTTMKAKSEATVARNKVYPFTQTPSFDIKPDWFYFEAVESGAQIGMTADDGAPSVSLQYSTDYDNQWKDFVVGTTTITLSNAGDRVYFKATTTNTAFTSTDNSNKFANKFNASANVNVGGNIMYLLDGETPENSITADFSFHLLFCNIEKLISASDLKLPATTLANSCYFGMFADCTSLVNAPALPATTLANSCYYCMFYGCTNLVNAPALPATTLADKCYQGMFNGCTALVDAPALPATTLANSCYMSMFSGCTNLVNAPALPATTLQEYCYSQMFWGCTNLVNAPALLATTLAKSCCYLMFNGCTSLVNAPALPATTLANSCYMSMFKGCTNLVNAPALPATTLQEYCYNLMFNGCTSLVNAPALPATTLAKSCYSSMFFGCTNLVNAPALPATTLTNSCYNTMFKGCTNLVNAPALPATTMIDGCYRYMFQNCSKLSSVTMLATNNFTATNCLQNWLKNAGTDASVSTRTIYVATGMVDDVKATCPSSPDWQTGVQEKP